MTPSPKPVRWVGSALRDLRTFPREARREVGRALFAAQQGRSDPSAKPLHGFGGASVLEIVVSNRAGAWRAVYTVRFQDAIYVLHAFQKKSTKGVATPTREVEMIRRRLGQAEQDSHARQN